MNAEKLLMLLKGQGQDVTMLAQNHPTLFDNLADAWERTLVFRRRVEKLYIEGANGVALTPSEMEWVKLLSRAQDSYRQSLTPKADLTVLKALGAEKALTIDLDQKPLTALMAAKLKEAHTKIQKDDLSAIVHLKQNGIDVNQKDRDGITSLSFAAQVGADRCLFGLCRVGANPHVTDSMGNSALHWACANSKGKAASLLLYNGANINASNHMGATALMLALGRNEMELAQRLLDYGADLRLKDRKGNTVLHKALLDRSRERVKFLIECGAPLDEANNEQLTPLGLSLKYPEFNDIFEPLRRKAVEQGLFATSRRG